MIGAKIPAWGGLVRLSGIYVTDENGRNIASNKIDKVGELSSKAGYYAIGAGYTYPFSKRTSVYGVSYTSKERTDLARTSTSS